MQLTSSFFATLFIAFLAYLLAVPAAAGEDNTNNKTKSGSAKASAEKNATADKSNGFVELFNGKDLSGWVPESPHQKKDTWSIKDGIVQCAAKKGYGFLRYDKKLCDFTLHIEYRLSERCNSGIGIRHVKFTGPRNTRPSTSGYEIQILDDAGKKPGNHSSTSLYRYLAPTENATLPHGQWNVIDITCIGPKIKITHNGKTVHDIDQSKIDKIKKKPFCGYVSLQNHGGKIEFRNVKLKKIPKKNPKKNTDG